MSSRSTVGTNISKKTTPAAKHKSKKPQNVNAFN